MASHNRAKKIANLASIPNKINYRKKRQLDSFASKTVDDDMFSSCQFMQLNNNYEEELITEINMPSNNVEPKYNVITNSNGTENVDTFPSEIVDIGISSACEFVKSNENSYAELITETINNNMQSDNVESMYNISFNNSNGTENVDTFTSEIVDIDISTCKFVQLINNNYEELITETDIPSDNAEHNNFILHSSNDTENVDTFQSDNVDKHDLSLNRKRQNEWQREQTKRNRMSGKTYLGYQRNEMMQVSYGIQRQERQMSETCQSIVCKKSSKRFCGLFDEVQRLALFNTFWESNWDEKRTFVINTVITTQTKMSTTEEISRRNISYKYHLRFEQLEQQQVCKKMYLNTLGLKESMVHNWLKKSSHGFSTSKNNKCTPQASLTRENEDPIKKYTCSLEERKQTLTTWFEKLPKMPSHYCRKNTDRLYLEGPFECKSQIFELYVDYCKNLIQKPLSKTFFSWFMKKKKFSIFRPRNDQCDLCISFKEKHVSQQIYEKHINEKKRAQEEKNLDKTIAESDASLTVFTMDMMAVKLCPIFKASALYYNMKLKVHNFTLYNLANRESMNYWWHEGDGETEASIFCSILIKHISNLCTLKPATKKIVLFSDGCGYQNRNVILSNALLHYSITHKIEIEQKYLVKGHTQMECDSVHSTIERHLKDKEVYLPSEFVRLTKESRKPPAKPYQATQLNYTDFLNYKSYQQRYKSIRPGNCKGDPEVKDIRSLKYCPTTEKIFYKLSFDNEYLEMPHKILRVKNDQNVEYPKLYSSSILLTLSKWNDLQRLKPYLPSDTHTFYDGLKHETTLHQRKKNV